MKYPFILFFRHDKYKYIDNILTDNSSQLNCTLHIINKKTQLNKFYKQIYPILIVFGKNPEEYKDDYTLNGAFASDLDDIIIAHPNLKVWCFGHTHSLIDITVGETRLITNPRGYAGYEQRVKEFDPSFGFDI
jgi:hypothetical protein